MESECVKCICVEVQINRSRGQLHCVSAPDLFRRQHVSDFNESRMNCEDSIQVMTLPLSQASRSTLNAVKILKMWRISTALYTGLLKSHALLGAFFPFCTVVGAMRWWRNRTGTVKWNNTSENPQNCCQYEVKLSPWHFEVTLECGENSACEAHTLSKYPLNVTT